VQLPIFVGLIIGYKIHKHGFKVSKWGPERSEDLSNCVTASGKRKGRLQVPDSGLTRGNLAAFSAWVWAWVK
jgi:amino acid transporter